MGFTISNNDYSGSFKADQVISDTLHETVTFSGGYVNIIPGVITECNIPVMSTSVTFAVDTCGFTASGGLTLDNKKIVVKTIVVQEEYCKTDIEPHYFQYLLKSGAGNSDVPTPISKWLVDTKSKLSALEVERQIWVGSGSGAEFTGVYTQAATDGNVVVASSAGTTLTAANIIAQLALVYNAIPSQLAGKPEFKIFISRKAASLYKLALSSATGDANFSVYGDKKLDFLGIELVSVPLADNKMLGAMTTNLFYACDLATDIENIEVIDRQPSSGERKVRYQQRMRGAAGYGLSAEMVIYK